MDTQYGAMGTMRKGVRFLSSQGVLLAAAALVLASSAIAGSGTLAGFQATTNNPSNVFNAGILRMTNVAGTSLGGTDCTTDGTTGGVLSGTCQTLVSTSLRVPGDSTSNTVTIANVGNVDGLLSLGVGTIAGQNAVTPGGNVPACGSTSNYLGRINVTLSRGAETLASTTLASLATNGPFTGHGLAAGASETYTVSMAFQNANDPAVDNLYQNCAVSPFALNWTLVQRAPSTTGAPNAAGASS